MYFKLYQVDAQCQKYAMIGLIPFFGQYFLAEGDEGFERYKKECYIEKEDRLAPFVTQQILFEISQVDNPENILFCFDWGLSLQAKNWMEGEIKNIAPIPYKQRIEEYSKNLVAKEVEINLAYSKSLACTMVDYKAVEGYRVK